MQYKVPQNIDLEDKIVGPFTMKQFVYILVSGFIVYGWWNFSNTYETPPPMVIFVPITLPVGLLGLSLALVKVNDRPFEIFLLSLLRFAFGPKKRVWQEGYSPEEVIVRDPAAPRVIEPKTKDTRSLDELSKSLEKQSETLRQKQAGQTPSTLRPTAETKGVSSINLSVKDIKTAAEKQAKAQQNQAPPAPSAESQVTPTPPAPQTLKKKKFLGIF